MKLKFAKIICFPILFIFFGLDHVSEALNYSNSIDIQNETSELISKKGGGGKKGGGKKGGGKKGGGKKEGGKKKGDKKTQINFNKVESNNEAMRDPAKLRYKKWKDNESSNKKEISNNENPNSFISSDQTPVLNLKEN